MDILIPQLEQLTQRQQEIIYKSIKIISEQGLQHLTIKNISAAIGVTERAIYRHFKSKSDIIITIVNVFRKNMSQVFKKLQAEEHTPIESIDRFFEIHFENFNNNPYMTVLLFSDEMFRETEGLSNFLQSIINMAQKNVAKMIEKGQKVGQVRDDIKAIDLALMLLGTYRLFILNWHLGGHKADLTKTGEEVRKLILGVLCK